MVERKANEMPGLQISSYLKMLSHSAVFWPNRSEVFTEKPKTYHQDWCILSVPLIKRICDAVEMQ